MYKPECHHILHRVLKNLDLSQDVEHLADSVQVSTSLQCVLREVSSTSRHPLVRMLDTSV